MGDEKERICRLCLKVLPDNSFDSLTETHGIQLHYILPELNLLATHDPVLCKSCVEIVQQSYDFKRSCDEIERYLENFSTPTKQINLEEVVSNRTSDKGEKKLKLEHEGRYRICRLCLGITEGNDFRELGIIEENLLQKCIPEMNLNLTDNPVSCDNCMELLYCQHNLIMKSQDIEEIISNYNITTKHSPNGSLINLHDILRIKLEKSYTENTYESSKIEDEIDEDWRNIIDSSETKEPLCEDTLGISSTSDINSTDDSKRNINENTQQLAILHKCDLCPYTANLKFSLDIHKLIHEKPGDVTTYKCTQCDYETKQKNHFLLHNKEHKKPSITKLYYCKECDFKSKWSSNLSQHQRSHRPPDQVMLKCPDCSYQTIVKGNLTTHMTLHKNPDELVMYKCSECLYQTRLKHSLTKHFLIHKNQAELTRYKCTDCDYESKWKWHVTRHRVTRHSKSVNIYKCAQCPYEGKHKFYLRRHMKMHKNTDKTEVFKCDLCDFQTLQKDQVKQHKNNMHNCSFGSFQGCIKEKLISRIKSLEIPKAYKCDLCPFECKQIRYFQRHRKGHLLENPDVVKFKCEFCPFQTVKKHILTNHGLIHQNYDELEKYKCDMCTYQTIRKGDLPKHFRNVHKIGVHPK